MRDVGGREPLRPEIDGLYDAFQHSRASRVELPLLTPGEARAYVAEVRDKALDVLGRSPLNGRRLSTDGFAFGMIVQHEQQHDETMLATHQLRAGPPVLAAPPPPPGRPLSAARCWCPRGPFRMGTSTEPWALDNERPAHVVDVPAFRIDTAPVTNGAVRRVHRRRRLRRPALVDGGGLAPPHARPGSSRRVLGARRRTARGGGAGSAWSSRCRPTSRSCTCASTRPTRTPRGRAGGCPPRPSGRRRRATTRPPARSRRYPWGDDDPTPAHANLGQRHLQPAPVGAYPAGASPLGVHQLIGDVWEWTTRAGTRYPGFAAFPYREYSEVFFGGDYRVLRGGSFGTDPAAVPRHVPQLGLPDPPADLRRVPAAPGTPTRRRPAAWPSVPPPGLPRPADPLVGAAARPAARAAAPVLGAARHARRRHGQRRRVRRRLVRRARRRRRPLPQRRRRSGPTRRSPTWPAATPVRRGARGGALGDGRHAGHGDGGGAVRRRAGGCSATTAWSAAGRARWRRSPPRCRSPTCSPSTRPPTRRCCGRWCAHRLRAGDDPGRRAGRRRRRGRRGRAGLAAQPAAHRRRDGLGHRLGPRAVRARRARRASLVASEPLDDDPGWTGVPDRHLVVARPARTTDPCEPTSELASDIDRAAACSTST